MRRILVTGANKGIGAAIAERILEEADDTFVFLGCRDVERGREAAERISSGDADRSDRIKVIELDVARDASVMDAARKVRDASNGEKLYGVVNNAGIGLGDEDLDTVFNVNTRGIMRVCEAFLALLADGGRVVNITSASVAAKSGRTSSRTRQ